jgi:hypothetical protein
LCEIFRDTGNVEEFVKLSVVYFVSTGVKKRNSEMDKFWERRGLSGMIMETTESVKEIRWD